MNDQRKRKHTHDHYGFNQHHLTLSAKKIKPTSTTSILQSSSFISTRTRNIQTQVLSSQKYKKNHITDHSKQCLQSIHRPMFIKTLTCLRNNY